MQQTKLKIIFTSDIHGCFFPYDYIHGKETTGSLSRVLSYVKKLRRIYGKNLILLDGGDIIQGQPTCGYDESFKLKDATLATDVYNYMKYDAITIGNHDVEAGHEVYDRWRKDTEAPILSANIISTETEKPYFKPYSIIERGGVRIAVLGITTPTMAYWLNETKWKGMRFDDALSSARIWVDRIRNTEHPDIVIGMFHTGWDGGINANGQKENATKQVTATVDGFDIILFGHDHKCHCETITNFAGRKVLCVNPSSDGNYVGEINIEIISQGKSKHITNIDGHLKSLEDTAPDRLFMEDFHEEEANIRKYIECEIGKNDTKINTFDCYFGCSPLNDFIHRIQLHVTGADISFTAPLAYNEHLDKGKIRVRDLFKLYRYENNIYAVRMTGREIKNYLEMSYDFWIRTTSPHDKHVMRTKEFIHQSKTYTFFENLTSNFDCASGIDYTVDVSKEKGNRIKISKMSNGTIFKENAFYKVAMHSYRGNGGAELLTKGAGIRHEDLPTRIAFVSKHNLRYYMMKEIETEGTLAIERTNNWRFIPNEWTEEAINRDKQLILGQEENS